MPVMLKRTEHPLTPVADQASSLSLNDETILQQIVYSSYAVSRICVWGIEKIGCLISLSRLDEYSTFHCPGLPLRTLNSSTFHLGKPTPGIPSSNSLGSDVIHQRETQAIVLMILG